MCVSGPTLKYIYIQYREEVNFHKFDNLPKIKFIIPGTAKSEQKQSLIPRD